MIHERHKLCGTGAGPVATLPDTRLLMNDWTPEASAARMSKHVEWLRDRLSRDGVDTHGPDDGNYLFTTGNDRVRVAVHVVHRHSGPARYYRERQEGDKKVLEEVVVTDRMHVDTVRQAVLRCIDVRRERRKGIPVDMNTPEQ